jgi:transcriptional regulator with XRE-family HTH domain
VAQGPGRGPEGLDEAFGRALRSTRRSKGLTQEALGFAGNLHPTYVSLLERGRNSPSLRALFVLADALGVRPSDLVARAEEELRNPTLPH